MQRDGCVKHTHIEFNQIGFLFLLNSLIKTNSNIQKEEFEK